MISSPPPQKKNRKQIGTKEGEGRVGGKGGRIIGGVGGRGERLGEGGEGEGERGGEGGEMAITWK